MFVFMNMKFICVCSIWMGSVYICIYNCMRKYVYDFIVFVDVWFIESFILDFSWNLLGFILNFEKEKKKKFKVNALIVECVWNYIVWLVRGIKLEKMLNLELRI